MSVNMLTCYDEFRDLFFCKNHFYDVKTQKINIFGQAFRTKTDGFSLVFNILKKFIRHT